MLPLAAVVVIAALGIAAAIFWPRKTTPPAVKEVPPETTGVTQAPAGVELSVRAQLPPGVSRAQVKTITLEIGHPTTGVTTDTVEAIGGVIQSVRTVAPADSIRLTLRGYDGSSRTVFQGKAVVNAGEGERVVSDIPLRAVPSDTVKTREVTAERKPNLVINVTPFSERDRIEKIWLDERPISGSFPLKQSIAAGRHTLRWKIGANRWTDTVTVGSEDRATEKDLFVGTGIGRVTVAATISGGGGYGDIWLDGVSTGLGTPGRLESVVAGPHEFAVKLEGYQMRTGSQIVDVKANSDTLVRFEMVPRTR